MSKFIFNFALRRSEMEKKGRTDGESPTSKRPSRANSYLLITVADTAQLQLTLVVHLERVMPSEPRGLYLRVSCQWWLTRYRDRAPISNTCLGLR